jgi:hypothetical protein
MFGLMRHAPRLPYCGVCKTLGAVYGQRARVLLNHDTVFLAEVLLELGSEPGWNPAYRSFNCLTLPRKNTPIPLALEYTAAVTVALAHFHIADHRRDSKKLKWRLAAKWFSPQYRLAAKRLRGWRFPLDQMGAALATQAAREARPESLAHVAEPTVVSTALVFSYGVRLVGRPDLADAAHRLGGEFGALIYLLDAYEDLARDALAGEFNPLLVFPQISAREEILAIVSRLERDMSPAHAARLRISVEERLGLRPRVLQERCRQSIQDRGRDALAFARSLRDRERAGFFKGLAVLASVSVLAFLFPQHARRTESWQECLGVSMNLMALGAMFSAPPQPPPPRLNIEPMRPDQPSVNPANCCSGLRGKCIEVCGEGLCEAACDSCG